MKNVFIGSYEDLQTKLVSLNADWDPSQANKKVLRLNGGIMNWYKSTGTLQFQGKQEQSLELEGRVKALLYPDVYAAPTLTPETQFSKNVEPVLTASDEVLAQAIDLPTQYLNGGFDNSEIVIGIVSAVGTEVTRVITPLKDRFARFGYHVEEIKVSSLLSVATVSNEYERIKGLMKSGDDLRGTTQNNAILAYGSAKLICEKRDSDKPKRAYVVNSLKHPEEVEILRKIYGQGFYLFGIHADKKRRLHYLTNDKGLTIDQATELTEVDEDENIKHGQRTRDTYHLSDFFINFGKNDDQVKNTIQRFLELIFSHPYKNPTFDEFSMFMAFSSSVRSGDLSRQVGAVIAKNQQILSTGANECPSSGGGLYWAELDSETGNVIDATDGKDYMRNEDSNKAEQADIIKKILSDIEQISNVESDAVKKIREVLENSRIKDLTEFGRVVHAEMEAILSCSREGISCIDSTLYCTTFPCHNCAKHIIAAGVKRVVYVEPYPKSKALDFHSDSIDLKTQLDNNNDQGQVIFEPFTGVGARRFLDFFSMTLGSGNKLKRKDKEGVALTWEQSNAKLRVSLLPISYIDIEKSASDIYAQLDR
jgi:deoxycytidylate deaminase